MARTAPIKNQRFITTEELLEAVTIRASIAKQSSIKQEDVDLIMKSLKYVLRDFISKGYGVRLPGVADVFPRQLKTGNFSLVARPSTKLTAPTTAILKETIPSGYDNE
ncbi:MULTISPECIES: hypothetical protein [Bacillus subtilis group]|uniref:hypothetical protein n=1 Tax=Bacillus subtilis group TaxID=653685 RepID=UPI0010452BFA|nr:hypothetical protein [Bacillus velezensis]HEO2443521.1 hypothetical protein [Streptococcus agalactiae]MCT6684644.1 hypothetical protein [Bacillus velezensis]MCY0092289.1 hypothetical protein [Bacillus velezensis]MEC0385630.1 hypothetical protein [Bacillus velezensis]MEC0388772.1 hypothetical protein [Bacillus velezensis]